MSAQGELALESEETISLVGRVVAHGIDRIEKKYKKASERIKKMTFERWVNGRAFLYSRELKEVATALDCDIWDRKVVVAIQQEMRQMMPEPSASWLTPVCTYLTAGSNTSTVGDEPAIILVEMIWKH